MHVKVFLRRHVIVWSDHDVSPGHLLNFPLRKNSSRVFPQEGLIYRELWNQKSAFSSSIDDDHHQSVLPNDRSFTANAGTKVAVLSKGRSSTANSGTTFAVLLGLNSCGSFSLLSAPHSLFSIWTDLKPGVFKPRSAGRLRPSGVFCSALKLFHKKLYI